MTKFSIAERIKAAPRRELCSSELTWDPWVHDARPEEPRSPLYGPGASYWDGIPASAPAKTEIPGRYRRSPDEEIPNRIAVTKASLDAWLVVLCVQSRTEETRSTARFAWRSF